MNGQPARSFVATVVLLLCSSISALALGQVCDRNFYGPEERIFSKSNEYELPLSWASVAGIESKTLFGSNIGVICAAYSDKNLTELFGFKVAFGNLEHLIPLNTVSRGGRLYEVGDSPGSEIPGQFAKQGKSHLYAISVALVGEENFVAESSSRFSGDGESVHPDGPGLSEYNAYVFQVEITDKASIRPGSTDKAPAQHVLTLVNEWQRIEGKRKIYLLPNPEALKKSTRIKQILFGTTEPEVSLVQDGHTKTVRYEIVEKVHPPIGLRKKRGLFRRLREWVPGFTEYVYKPVHEWTPVYQKVEDLEGVRSIVKYEMTPLNAGTEQVER